MNVVVGAGLWMRVNAGGVDCPSLVEIVNASLPLVGTETWSRPSGRITRSGGLTGASAGRVAAGTPW
jgi:hypothetical protein